MPGFSFPRPRDLFLMSSAFIPMNLILPVAGCTETMRSSADSLLSSFTRLVLSVCSIDGLSLMKSALSSSERVNGISEMVVVVEDDEVVEVDCVVDVEGIVVS